MPASSNIPVVTPEAIDRIVRQMVEIADPLRVILFGSAARGETHRDSDVDLLVVVPDGSDKRQVMGELFQRVKRTGVPCDFLAATPEDLVRYRNHPGLIYGTVLSEGRDVYVRDELAGDEYAERAAT